MQSNKDFLKHIRACLSDIWSQGCHRLSAAQKKSEKDRQHFKINQLHLLSSSADGFFLGGKEGTEGRRKDEVFSIEGLIFFAI